LNKQIPIERGLATRLQARAKGNGYGDRLLALAQGGAIPAARAQELNGQIQSKWNDIAQLLGKQWPVDPTRVCRAPLLVFEGVMYADETPGKAGQLDDARRILQSCVNKATVPLELLTRLNREFDGILGEAERVIADSRAVKSSAPSGRDEQASSARPSAAGK
jgi:hypothetical protein